MISVENIKKALSVTLPERWEALAETVDEGALAFFEKEALCRFFEEYPIFPDHAAMLLEAAKAIHKNEALRDYMLLLSRAISDWDTIQEDIAALTLPVPAEKEERLPFDMMPLLACLPHIPPIFAALRQRGVEEKVLFDTFSVIDTMMPPPPAQKAFDKGNLSWVQHYLHGVNLRIGHLFFHRIDDMYNAHFGVYRSLGGQYRLLAEKGTYHLNGHLVSSKESPQEGDFTASLSETEEYYEAYYISEEGLVHPEATRLDKKDWTRVGGHESPSITIHIPSGPGLTPENVKASFRAALDFHRRHFPEFKPLFFHCHSWLLDTQHRQFLPPTSNILAFQSCFIHGNTTSYDNCVFDFLFRCRKENLQDLPESSSLQRTIKRHLLEGNHIYEQNGVIPLEWVKEYK